MDAPGPETIADCWDNPFRPWPSVVYVETTNKCNANCVYCLNDRVSRPRCTMSLDDFKRVADKVKARGAVGEFLLKIGAMFTFGEPLIDAGLEEKYAYGRSIDVFASHVGLNTNCHFLTPDRFDSILENVPDIILSFVNVGPAFERLTGLSWERCYGNAKAFIQHRDKACPDYPVFVSVNKVAGHDLEAVKEAFAGRNVKYVQDAELRYDKGRCVEGVLDRTRMFHDWRCDGYVGAIHVGPDLSCDFCAYDIMGAPSGIGETRFSRNFLEDSWYALEVKFKARWALGASLCRRCDYWRGCKVLKHELKLADRWVDG